MFDNSFLNRVLFKSLCALLLPACMVWGAYASWARPPAPSLRPIPSHELPPQWDGQPLRPLALSEVEQRFARQFPGTLARMTDGRQVLVLRAVSGRPACCIRPPIATAAWVTALRTSNCTLDPQQRLWRCFEAARAGQRLGVCERIVGRQAAPASPTHRPGTGRRCWANRKAPGKPSPSRGRYEVIRLGRFVLAGCLRRARCRRSFLCRQGGAGAVARRMVGAAALRPVRSCRPACPR